jgi:hypothetical protein
LAALRKKAGVEAIEALRAALADAAKQTDNLQSALSAATGAADASAAAVAAHERTIKALQAQVAAERASIAGLQSAIEDREQVCHPCIDFAFCSIALTVCAFCFVVFSPMQTSREQLAALNRLNQEVLSLKAQGADAVALRSQVGQLVEQLQRAKFDVDAGVAELTSLRLVDAAHAAEARAATERSEALERDLAQLRSRLYAAEAAAANVASTQAEASRAQVCRRHHAVTRRCPRRVLLTSTTLPLPRQAAAAAAEAALADTRAKLVALEREVAAAAASNDRANVARDAELQRLRGEVDYLRPAYEDASTRLAEARQAAAAAETALAVRSAEADKAVADTRRDVALTMVVRSSTGPEEGPVFCGDVSNSFLVPSGNGTSQRRFNARQRASGRHRGAAAAGARRGGAPAAREAGARGRGGRQRGGEGRGGTGGGRAARTSAGARGRGGAGPLREHICRVLDSVDGA